MSEKQPDRKRLLARTSNWRQQKASERKQPKLRTSRNKLPPQYPIVRVEKSLANPGFAKLVEQVVEQIDFADPRFSPDLQQFLQLIARDGAKATESTIHSMSRLVHGRANLWESLRFSFEIGDRIISDLAGLSKEELFPFNDVEVRFLGNSVVLGLSSMMSTMDGKHKIYYSRRRFSLNVNGENLVLAFHAHAIERICQRFKPDYRTYGGLGDAHGLFSGMNYVEQVNIGDRFENQGPAVCLFDILEIPGTWEFDTYMQLVTPFPKKTLGKFDGSSYAYRVGYCPIYKKDQFAVAYTYLPPGYRRTPEGIRLRTDQTLTYEGKQRLCHLARHMDKHTLQFEGAFDAVRWFHEHDHPQVIITNQQVIDYEYSRKKLGLR